MLTATNDVETPAQHATRPTCAIIASTKLKMSGAVGFPGEASDCMMRPMKPSTEMYAGSDGDGETRATITSYLREGVRAESVLSPSATPATMATPLWHVARKRHVRLFEQRYASLDRVRGACGVAPHASLSRLLHSLASSTTQRGGGGLRTLDHGVRRALRDHARVHLKAAVDLQHDLRDAVDHFTRSGVVACHRVPVASVA